jgi:hypothetical protein
MYNLYNIIILVFNTKGITTNIFNYFYRTINFTDTRYRLPTDTICRIYSFIHSVFCLTTGPKPPSKRFLHIARSRASSFKWEYPLLSLRIEYLTIQKCKITGEVFSWSTESWLWLWFVETCRGYVIKRNDEHFCFLMFTRVFFIYIILNWGPVPHFCPLEALQPVWCMPEAYCTIPRFLIVPTLAAMCLSRPQPAVVT